MPRRAVLDTAAHVVLTAAGGRVFFTVPAFQVWELTRVTVTGDETSPMPDFSLYRSVAEPGRLLIHTRLGLADTADGNPETFQAGQLIVGVWSEGTGQDPGMPVGATATVTLGGIVTLLGVPS